MGFILTVANVATIALCAAIISNVWVHVLTKPQAIFKKAPLYYGEGFIHSVMTCEKCLSGWLSMIVVCSVLTNAILTDQDWIYYIKAIIKVVVYTILSGCLGIYLGLLIGKTIR